MKIEKTLKDQLPEFKVGDVVTYKPYELSHEAEVLAVLPNHFGDGRLIYYLRAYQSQLVVGDKLVKKHPVLTYTTPENIVESKFFNPYDWI